MPRPRKPLKILEMSGALKKNPGRYKDRHEPDNLKPLGKPYAGLTDSQKECFHVIADSCHKGVLCLADTIAVEMAAVLLDKIRQKEAKTADMSLFNGYLTKFGMTPASRSTVPIQQPKKVNRFSD